MCLDAALKENMCILMLDSNHENASILDNISYACIFWVDHLGVVEVYVLAIIEYLRALLDRHLLH
jgi:hypothetical protein